MEVEGWTPRYDAEEMDKWMNGLEKFMQLNLHCMDNATTPMCFCLKEKLEMEYQLEVDEKNVIYTLLRLTIRWNPFSLQSKPNSLVTHGSNARPCARLIFAPCSNVQTFIRKFWFFKHWEWLVLFFHFKCTVRSLCS